MSEKISTDQYGRKKWDVEAYEAEAKRSRQSETSSKQASNEALKNRLKNKNFLQHRAELLDSSVDAIAKHTLVGAGSGVTTTFGKNKRFGFSCPTCDLSFRDTLALVDHFNSPQHLKSIQKLSGDDFGTGEELEGGVKRASTAQVIQTIEDLVKKSLQEKARNGEKGPGLTLQERVRRRIEFEEKRSRRKQERKKRKSVAKDPVPEVSEMGRLMGFEGFGTTKVD